MNLKFLQKMYRRNVNVSLMIESVIRIKSTKIINANVRAKNIIYVKRNVFGIFLLVVLKLENIYQALWTI